MTGKVSFSLEEKERMTRGVQWSVREKEKQREKQRTGAAARAHGTGGGRRRGSG